MFRWFPVLVLVGCIEAPTGDAAVDRCLDRDSVACLEQVMRGAQRRLDDCALAEGASEEAVSANRWDTEAWIEPVGWAEHEHRARAEELLRIRFSTGCRGWVSESAIRQSAGEAWALTSCEAFSGDTRR